MSMQVTTNTYSPEEKAMLLMAQSCNKLLQQREKTNAVYVQTVNELQHVNSSQADELQQMKAAMEFEKEAYQREVAILKAQLAAERAKHDAEMRLAQSRFAALSLENADNLNRRSEYYDIILGLNERPGYSKDAALHKCETFGF